MLMGERLATTKSLLLCRWGWATIYQRTALSLIDLKISLHIFLFFDTSPDRSCYIGSINRFPSNINNLYGFTYSYSILIIFKEVYGIHITSTTTLGQSGLGSSGNEKITF